MPKFFDNKTQESQITNAPTTESLEVPEDLLNNLSPLILDPQEINITPTESPRNSISEKRRSGNHER